jgi:hypothetical protein
VLHAVWVEYLLPNGWPPNGVFYARSIDGGQNWTAPETLAAGQYNQPNILTGTGNKVYATWVGAAGVGGKYFTQSDNGGETWSSAVAIAPPGTGGSEGVVSMALDTAANLHVLYSNQVCVWYATLERGVWANAECISQGVPANLIESPLMTISQGNRLHVLFWTNNQQLWYTSRQLPVPGQQLLPTPTAFVPTAVPPTVAPTLTPPPTHLPDYGPPMDTDLPAQTGAWAALAGFIPTAILIVIVYLSRRFGGRR